jgi:putative phosphoesterase
MIKRIGLISDTHGELATPVLEIFANTDAIIHAGDIGDPDILGELQKLAPVTAVMGNVDDQFTFPPTEG